MEYANTSIVLITADDLNYNSVGYTGCPIPDITPNLDAFAYDATIFDRAYVSISVCQPSRSSIMTGKYPNNNGAVGFNDICGNVTTLTELLRERGYINGIVGKETHLAPKDKFAWDFYIRTEDEEHDYGRDPESYYRYVSAFIGMAKRQGRPFFLMANSHDPHRPFAGSETETRMWGRHMPTTRDYAPEEVAVPGFLPDIPEVRREVAEYFTSVHRCDQTVGRILDALKENGLYEDTIILFLSDNGMAFPFAKTNCYINSNKTPLVMRWGGHMPRGMHDGEHFISGVDIMPTLLEILGIDHSGCDGISFRGILGIDGQYSYENLREEVYTSFNITSAKNSYMMRAILDERYLYIFNEWADGERQFKNESMSGRTFKAMDACRDPDVRARTDFFLLRTPEELYDTEKDPDALCNLLDGEGEGQALLRQYRARLGAYLNKIGDGIIAYPYR